ncbi:hypothetical protein QYF61_012799 [Mycteria americana]|uniref:Reverse transcriptase domain-containing protein n=1 Tax=Mycteria americana TaxID=33587 RepID=A0AAN7NJ21_MYCAM|nr:hypothetical protein QYF61_012799 [Mycteria americana]
MEAYEHPQDPSRSRPALLIFSPLDIDDGQMISERSTALTPIRRKLHRAVRPPLSLLLSKLDKPCVLSRSSKDMPSSPFPTFAAILGTCSSTLMSFLNCGHNLRDLHTILKKREDEKGGNRISKRLNYVSYSMIRRIFGNTLLNVSGLDLKHPLPEEGAIRLLAQLLEPAIEEAVRETLPLSTQPTQPRSTLRSISSSPLQTAFYYTKIFPRAKRANVINEKIAITNLYTCTLRRVLKELANVIAGRLSIIFQWSSESGEVPVNWKLANIAQFSRRVTHPVDQGKPVDVVVLDFSKAFDTVSHSILLDKTSSTQLDKSIIHWVSNWLMG